MQGLTPLLVVVGDHARIVAGPGAAHLIPGRIDQ